MKTFLAVILAGVPWFSAAWVAAAVDDKLAWSETVPVPYTGKMPASLGFTPMVVKVDIRRDARPLLADPRTGEIVSLAPLDAQAGPPSDQAAVQAYRYAHTPQRERVYTGLRTAPEIVFVPAPIWDNDGAIQHTPFSQHYDCFITVYDLTPDKHMRNTRGITAIQTYGKTAPPDAFARVCDVWGYWKTGLRPLGYDQSNSGRLPHFLWWSQTVPKEIGMKELLVAAATAGWDYIPVHRGFGERPLVKEDLTNPAFIMKEGHKNPAKFYVVTRRGEPMVVALWVGDYGQHSFRPYVPPPGVEPGPTPWELMLQGNFDFPQFWTDAKTPPATVKSSAAAAPPPQPQAAPAIPPETPPANVAGSLCSGDGGYCVPQSQVEEVKASPSPHLLEAALAAGDRIKAGCAACDKEVSGLLLAATLEQAGVADPQVSHAAAMALDAKYTGDLDRVAKDLAGSRKPADELLNLAGVLYANGVTRWDVIQGMLGLAVETANAKFEAKLKAPRLLAAVKRSFEGRRAGSNAPSLLSIDASPRAVQVVKGSTHEFTLIGRNFQRGARYVLWSPGRDPAAQPEPDTLGPKLYFVNSSELRVTLAISKDSPSGKYVVAVVNPDGKRSPETERIVELVEPPQAGPGGFN